MQQSFGRHGRRGGGGACCPSAELLLAERFDLAVAWVDVHAGVQAASRAARHLIDTHPALITSHRHLGLISSRQSAEFQIALRYVLSGQPAQTIRADDDCMAAPLALQVTPWRCGAHCLVSMHAIQPCQIDLAPLKSPFGLTPRQVEMLELFSTGLTLAEIAKELGLKPQGVRETFSEFYRSFSLRNQLELLSALKSLSLATSDSLGDST